MNAVRRLVLVRHGETLGESSIRYHGANDVELSAAGIEQMRRVAAALASEAFDLAVTSCLRRTVAAARIIAPHVPATAVTGFNEIDFGEWEGLTREEIRDRDPVRYEVWCAAAHDFAYPSGESVSGFRARVVTTLRELMPRMPQRTLIVAHKGVISSVLAELLGLAPERRARLSVDLGSVHVLERADDGWSAGVINRTDHLEGLR